MVTGKISLKTPATCQRPGAWSNLARRFDVEQLTLDTKPVQPTCVRCGVTKPLAAFYPHYGRKSRLTHMPSCRSCVNESTKKWAKENPAKRALYNRRWRQKNPDHWRRLALAKYGIGPDEYDALLEAQDGTCAICSRDCVTGRALHVDHDHETGKVRGLLCHKCNSGLGQFGDSLGLVKKALAYLEGS